MYDRAYAIATGAFLIAALAALVVTAYWLVGADTERRPYVVVSPYSVAGLSEGSQVMYRGVPAGRVERIGIDPGDPARVLVRITVDPEIPVRRSAYARLVQRGLTGIAEVELADTGEWAEPLPTSERAPARIPMAPSLLDEVTGAGARALERLSELADSLNAMLDEQNRARLRSVFGRLDAVLSSVEAIGEALEAELPRALSSATRAAESLGALADRTALTMNDVDRLIADLRETAAAAQGLAEHLEGRGLPGVDRMLESLNEAAAQISRLAQQLARQPQQLFRSRQVAPGPGEESP